MIKFVYFDVGGVIVDDFSKNGKWQKMKLMMGVKMEFDEEFDKLYRQYESKDLCLSRDVDSLIPIFSEKFDMEFPEKFSMLKYFIDHFDKNIAIWSIITEIEKRCGVGLLTNMYVGMLDRIKENGLLPPINWDVVIDSSVVGFQKPGIEIFELAEQRSGFNGKEILFVDNSQKNIDAANAFGWNTFFYDSSDKIKSSKELSRYLMAI